MKARYLLAALVLVGALAAARDAHAQYGYGYGYYRPVRVYTPAFVRDGLVIGFSVGGGVVAANDFNTTGGGQFGFRIGGMITRNFALLLDSENLFFPATVKGITNNATGYTGVTGPAFQVFFDPTPLWLKVGAGVSYFGASDAFVDYGANFGFGGIVTIGVDLVKFPHPWAPFALSLEGQLVPMWIHADDNRVQKLVNFTIGLGFSWY